MDEAVFTSALFYREPKVALRWLEQAFGFEVTWRSTVLLRHRRCATTR